MEAKLDEGGKAALRSARALLEEVELRAERLREIKARDISSPRMDGMPKGSGGGDATTARVISIEAREQQLRRDRRRLKLVQAQALRAIAPLRLRQRIFYCAYCIDGQSAESAAAEARISARTATRYLSVINK